MPPHLQLTLLNVPSTAEGAASLPRPQHVILNHIYIQRGQVSPLEIMAEFCHVCLVWNILRGTSCNLGTTWTFVVYRVGLLLCIKDILVVRKSERRQILCCGLGCLASIKVSETIIVVT